MSFYDGYDHMCESCYNKFGKPKNYKWEGIKKTNSCSPFFCIATDGDDYDDGSNDIKCSECSKKADGYYYRQFPEFVIKIESINQFEKIVKSREIVIADFYEREDSITSSVKDHFKNHCNPKLMIFVVIDLKKRKDVAKKENVEEECVLLYHNGKKTRELIFPEYTLDDYKDFYAFINVNKTIKSKKHEHELKQIRPEYLYVCSVCEEVIDDHDDAYVCIDCPFVLCQECECKERGEKYEKNKNRYKLIENEKQYDEIIKTNKKVVLFCYEKRYKIPEDLKEIIDFYYKAKFYLIKQRSRLRKIVDNPKEDEFIELENGKIVSRIILKELKRKIDKIKNPEPIIVDNDDQFKSSKHEHILKKSPPQNFICNVCRRSQANFGNPVEIFTCPKCDFILCLKCKKKEKK